MRTVIDLSIQRSLKRHMTDTMENLPAKKKARRLAVGFAVRPRVLIAGILSGGTMIAFPTATGVVVIYLACAIATAGMMAWAGAVALASVSAIVLVPPILTVIAILIIRAGVRSIIHLAWPKAATQDGAQQAAEAAHAADQSLIGQLTALRESLDRWENDGGSAAPPPRLAKPRIRYFAKHRQRPRVAPV